MASDANGSFVVVWAADQDGSGYGVFGQRFDFGGGPAIHVGDLDRRAKNRPRHLARAGQDHGRRQRPRRPGRRAATFNISAGVGTRTRSTTRAGVCEVSVVVGDAVPSLTFTVTSLSKGGFTYSPAANHDPDPDSNGNFIQVNQP